MLAGLAAERGFTREEALRIATDEVELEATRRKVVAVSAQGVRGISFFGFDDRHAAPRGRPHVACCLEGRLGKPHSPQPRVLVAEQLEAPRVAHRRAVGRAHEDTFECVACVRMEGRARVPVEACACPRGSERNGPSACVDEVILSRDFVAQRRGEGSRARHRVARWMAPHALVANVDAGGA